MNTATDYDNRSPEEVIAYLEARVEALTTRNAFLEERERVLVGIAQELEVQNKQLRESRNEELADCQAELDKLLQSGTGGRP